MCHINRKPYLRLKNNMYVDIGLSTSVSALKPTLVPSQEVFKHLWGQSVLSWCFTWGILVTQDGLPVRKPQVTVV